MTKQLEFSPEVKAEIHYQRYNHLAPLVQRRMEALWRKADELPHGQIAQLVGVSENTIREYFELYEQGGVERLKELNYYRPQSQLAEHIVSLEVHFRDHPPARIKQAQSEIEVITGVKRSETQVREFLKKNSICVAEGWG